MCAENKGRNYFTVWGGRDQVRFPSHMAAFCVASIESTHLTGPLHPPCSILSHACHRFDSLQRGPRVKNVGPSCLFRRWSKGDPWGIRKGSRKGKELIKRLLVSRWASWAPSDWGKSHGSMKRWHASASTPILMNFFHDVQHPGTSTSRLSLAKETPHETEKMPKL